MKTTKDIKYKSSLISFSIHVHILKPQEVMKLMRAESKSEPALMDYIKYGVMLPGIHVLACGQKLGKHQ